MSNKPKSLSYCVVCPPDQLGQCNLDIYLDTKVVKKHPVQIQVDLCQWRIKQPRNHSNPVSSLNQSTRSPFVKRKTYLTFFGNFFFLFAMYGLYFEGFESKNCQLFLGFLPGISGSEASIVIPQIGRFSGSKQFQQHYSKLHYSRFLLFATQEQ